MEIGLGVESDNFYQYLIVTLSNYSVNVDDGHKATIVPEGMMDSTRLLLYTTDVVH